MKELKTGDKTYMVDVIIKPFTVIHGFTHPGIDFSLTEEENHFRVFDDPLKALDLIKEKLKEIE